MTSLLLQLAVQKEIDTKTDLQEEETSVFQKSNYSKQDFQSHGNIEEFKKWSLEKADQARISHLKVRCEKQSIKVKITFSQPFYGIVFSKGYYNDPRCVHRASKSNSKEITFHISLGKCGMISSDPKPNLDSSHSPWFYTESTIVIQHNPQVQEIWDEARKIRCTWFDFYEKPIAFKPVEVDLMDAIQVNFLGDSIQCWMKIQYGKGPYANEVSGLVKIGQTMTLAVGIKVEDNKFDMLVRNCIAHDGKHKPIFLIDQYGCVMKPRIMSKFKKIKVETPSSSIISYAYFKAFKFPDSVYVYFECIIQVCRHMCPKPSCYDNPEDDYDYQDNYESQHHNYSHKDDFYTNYKSSIMVSHSNVTMNDTSRTTVANSVNTSLMNNHRVKRSEEFASTTVGAQKMIQVVAPGDVSLDLLTDAESASYLEDPKVNSIYCISSFLFTTGLSVIILFLAFSIFFAFFVYFRMEMILNTADGATRQLS